MSDLDPCPFCLTWFDCSSLVKTETLAVGPLPGMKHKKIWRNLDQDLKVLADNGISDVFCVCTEHELSYFRVKELFNGYRSKNIRLHHYPMEFRTPPDFKLVHTIVEDVWNTLLEGNKVFIHGNSLLGRVSVLMAALYMELEEKVTPALAIFKIRELLGNGAFQLMPQYNFIDSFREYQAQHMMHHDTKEEKAG